MGIFMKAWVAAEGIMKLLIVLVILAIPGVLVAISALVFSMMHAGVSIFDAVPEIVKAATQQLHNFINSGGSASPPTTT